MTSGSIIQVIFLLTFTLTVNAQIDWTSTYNLSNTPSATSDYHSVHSDEFGNYYVVWGDNGQIKFKYSSDWGDTWSSNITISSAGSWPVVKSWNNYVYIVYHHLASEYEIIFHYSSDYGQTWSTPQILSGMDSGSITPQLSVYGTNIYVVWEQRISIVSPKYEIYFVKSTDRGLTWSTEQNLSNTSGSNSRWVQLEAVGNKLYCTWLESVTYPASDIYFSKSTDGGFSWSTPINITNDERPQNRINMKLSPDGHIYIASDDIITFNFDEIYLIKSIDEGLTWSSAANITNNTGNSNTPCIEFWGDNLYFTWADNSHTAPAYDNMDIFFKWSSNGGIAWQDSINLSANPETSSRPRICKGIQGPLTNPWVELTVVWYDYSTGDAEILARRGNQYIVPVELTSFTATVKGNSVHLNWSTATEINNSGFEIERRAPSKSPPKGETSRWGRIGFVEGKNTTTEAQSYLFEDQNVPPGIYQYRLKQIDFDGSIEYSNVIEVEIGIPEKFELFQNYPNPFNPSTTIRWQSTVSSHQSLKVYDFLGREVATLVDEYKPAGRYEVEFDAASLSSGIYLYKLKAGDFIETKKMILMK